MTSRWLAALALTGTLCACSNTDPLPGTQVLMRFDGAGYFDAPFPSEHRRRADGTLDVSGFPNPLRSELLTKVAQILRRDVDGFGLTSGIYFQLTAAIDAGALPDLAGTTRPDASVFLVRVGDTARVPVLVSFAADGGPSGAPNLLSLLPLQGWPLQPKSTYVAAVKRALVPGASGELRKLLAGVRPAGLSEAAFARYREALAHLATLGIKPDELAGIAVFTTGAPATPMQGAVSTVLARQRPAFAPFVAREIAADFCVYESSVEMPVYQSGEAPYSKEGGGWVFDAGALVEQRTEHARVFVTVPRRPAPAGGFPAVVFIRTGGGGDRPLIDRGVRDAAGKELEPLSGPARTFAQVGWAGLSIDGPHGGPRNITQGDEQFLMFNVLNPVALRDNVRQSALEVVLTAHLAEDVRVPACPGQSGEVRLDASRLALMGHSMGATIAPLAMAYEPRFKALILSGAGGSWIENVIHKKKPLEVRPFIDVLLNYTDRTVAAHDPALSLLQWAGEAADPPVFGARLLEGKRHVLMLQGIVDHYIMPPIANATSVSAGLDLAKPPLEESLPALLPLEGRVAVDLPVSANRDGSTAVVMQHREDGVEDGHEVVFQTQGARHQYRCFLETFAADGVPTVVAPADETTPCR